MCRFRCTQWLPSWVQLWLLVSSLICAFDVFFTMSRPETLDGGELAFLTKPWRIYAAVDIRYNTTSDVVTCATGRLMIAEIALNVIALALAIVPCARLAAHSVVIAFASSCFVFWKTLLYMVMYIEPPPGSPDYLVDDFSFTTILVFWIADGIWVVVPLIVMLRLWPKLVPLQDTEYEYINKTPRTVDVDDYDDV